MKSHRVGGRSILIRYDHNGSLGLVRADGISKNVYRMLKRVTEGKPARIDEHDDGTFAIRGGPPA